VVPTILDKVCLEIVKDTRRLGHGFRVIDAGVGIRYSYVLVEDLSTSKHFIGLSYTPLEEISHPSIEVSSFEELSIDGLCGLITSANFISRALAMSAINALTSALTEIPRGSRGLDILDLMTLGGDDTVAVVGYVEPLLDRIRGLVRKVYVFERNWLRRRNALPDTLLHRLLPEATAVIISGSALLNDTIDSIIESVRPEARIALVGATGSVKPEPLFKAGIQYVGGFRANPGEEGIIAELIRLGAGTREVYRHGFKYVLVGPPTYKQ